MGLVVSYRIDWLDVVGSQSVSSIPPPYPPTTGYEPCAVTDPELFFPERNNNFLKITEIAKSLCRTCPIQSACLNYAIGTDVEGIWGGTDEKERRILQKRNEIEPYKLMKVFSQFLPN